MILTKNSLIDVVVHFLVLLTLVSVFHSTLKVHPLNKGLLMLVGIAAFVITFLNHTFFPQFTVSALVSGGGSGAEGFCDGGCPRV